MSIITIYIKNLAGDLFPIDVEPTLPLHEIAQQLTLSDPEAYPINRVCLFRFPQEEEEEQGDEKESPPPLSPDDILSVYILDPYRIEHGVFPQGGEPYSRIVFPFRGRTLYLYLTSYESGSCTRTIQFAVSWTPDVTKPPETFHAHHLYLYQTMKTFIPDVTPTEMRTLYDIVLPYCDQMGTANGCKYIHTLHPKEPVECQCGAIIKRSGMLSHIRTKKHISFVQQQYKQYNIHSVSLVTFVFSEGLPFKDDLESLWRIEQREKYIIKTKKHHKDY